MTNDKISQNDENDSAEKSLLASHDSDFPSKTTKRFLLLIFVLCIHFLAYGTSVPVISFYVFDKISSRYDYNISSSDPCIQNTSSGNRTVENRIQKEVTKTYLMLTLIWLLPGVVPTLFLGPFIDRSGRKKALLIAMVGTFLKQISVLVVIVRSLSVNYIAIGDFLEGITGGFGTVLMVAFGMVADLTPPGKRRTLRITVIEVCNAVGVSVSVVTVGILLRHHKTYTSPVYLHALIVSAALSAIAIIITSVFVRETLLHKVSNTFCAALKNVRKCFTFYIYDTPERRRWKILVCITIFILTLSVNFSYQEVINIFLMRRPLCWHEVKVTTFSSVNIIASSGVVLLTLKLVQKYLNLEDRHVAVAGCFSSLVAMVVFAFAWTDWMVYLGAIIGLLVRLIIPMTRSIMSRTVQQDEQGALFAGMGCIEMTFPVIVSSLSTLLYRATEQIKIGVVFLVLSGLMFIVLLLYTFLNIRISRQNRYGYQAVN